ncbi:MAG: FecR family protein [Chitinophagaceae bacterium]|nr:FecR family protein [Chitinophagaceae bacterium]
MDINQKENNRLWYLLARKMANEIAEAENRELITLLQANPDALYAQEILSQQWLDSYKKFSSKDADDAFEKHQVRMQKAIDDNAVSEYENNIEENAQPKVRVIWWRYVSVAAACILVALILFKWNNQAKPQTRAEELQQLATQYGSKSQLILPDGTKVWLNGGSTLDYPKQFSGPLREVTLEGEAFFDVTENKQQPFLVHTKTFTVKVLGTAFNIRAYKDEDSASASLIRGSVEVELNTRKNNKVLLRPNEKLVVSAAPAMAEPREAATHAAIAPVEAEVKKSLITTDRFNTVAETAWVDNKLVFKNKSFEQIALVLEKWFAVEICFKNENRKKLNLSGTFDGENLDEILKAFMETGASTFSYKKDTAGAIIIY